MDLDKWNVFRHSQTEQMLPANERKRGRTASAWGFSYHHSQYKSKTFGFVINTSHHYLCIHAHSSGLWHCRPTQISLSIGEATECAPQRAVSSTSFGEQYKLDTQSQDETCAFIERLPSNKLEQARYRPTEREMGKSSKPTTAEQEKKVAKFNPWEKTRLVRLHLFGGGSQSALTLPRGPPKAIFGKQPKSTCILKKIQA